MRIKTLVASLFLLSAFAMAAQADDLKKEAHKAKGTNAALEQFKQLAGEWVGKESADGKEVRVSYDVKSGGSAVVETIHVGDSEEMITVIHADGDDLALTHYCMLGNQPTMKTEGGADGKKVDFKFVRATNMKSDKDMHMHNVSFTFVDKDTLKTEWTNYQDGKAAGHVVFELKRKN
jgi:hypothetical protein